MQPIPTITQLAASVKSSIETYFGINISATGKSMLRAFVNTLAGQLKLLYLVLGFVQKNIWFDTADSESIGGTLERFGRTFLNRNPFAPVAGKYEITVTGSVSATIPAGQTFRANDDSLSPGIIYVLDEAYTLVATTDTIIVRALTAGIAGKLNLVDKLTPTSPIALVDSTAIVAAETVQPLAGETLDEYRAAIAKRVLLEPTGGSDGDYRIWASDAQGIKEVYPYKKSGGYAEVDLYVEATIADSDDGKGTPSASLLADVEDVVNFSPDTTLDLNERGRRPTQVIVDYIAVTVKEVDIIITGATGFTAAEKIAIEAALITAINKVRPFVAGADILSLKNDVIDNNAIVGVIVTVKPGAVFTSVTILIDSVATPSYVFTAGDIPHPNSVTYA